MIHLAAFLTFLCLSPAIAEELRGKIVKITDGDTLAVLDAEKIQHKIRLEEIDAPESKQAFGTRSKQSLGEKVAEKDVRIVWEEKDRYGRILRDIYLEDRYINREMLESELD